MKFLNKILLLMILLLERKKLISMCNPQTPCPNIFLYKYGTNFWYGELSILVPDVNAKKIHLFVSYFSSEKITKDISNSLNFVGTDEEFSANIRNRRPIKIILAFPFPNNPPGISEIKLNGVLICQGEQGPDAIQRGVVEKYFTVIQESQTFYVSANGQTFRPPVQTPRPPVQTPRPSAPSPRPPIVPSPRPPLPQAPPRRPWQQQNQNDLQDRLYDLTDTTNNCGVFNVVKPLVVNGETAPESLPWLVALFDNDKRGPKFFCAGSLISKQFVVTAAHCIIGKSLILIKLGDKDVSSINGPEGTIIKTSIQIEPHPDYRPSGGSNGNADIAIIKLSSPVEFSNNIRPVCLWPNKLLEEKFIVNRNAAIYGWGNDENGQPTMGAPKRTTLKIKPYEECKRMDLLRNVISDKTICAAGSNSASGPCLGDSGGGLYIIANHKWTIRGVISSAIGLEGTRTCDVENYFSVYTDTGKYFEWIRNTFEKYK